MPSLQDNVAAIVRFVSDRPGRAKVDSVVGTGFFIDTSGTFVTTRTALVDGQGTLGLAVHLQSAPAPFAIMPITQHEFANAPWDVAIGRVTANTRRVLLLGDVGASSVLWERVSSYGCVGLDAVTTEHGTQPVFRALAGGVQREIAERDGNAPGFELGFAIPTALRGAPLFVRDQPRSRLLGICIGNGSLGSLDHVMSGGTTESRPDRYGIAQDLRALSHWRPQLLYGRSLREAIDG